MKRKILVWLALFALLLAGCTDQAAVVTTEPTTVSTTVPATTLPLATDIYADAVSAIGADITAKVNMKTEMVTAYHFPHVKMPVRPQHPFLSNHHQ